MAAMAVWAARIIFAILFFMIPFSTAGTHSFTSTVGLAVTEPLTLEAAQRVRYKWNYLQMKVAGFDARWRTAGIER